MKDSDTQSTDNPSLPNGANLDLTLAEVRALKALVMSPEKARTDGHFSFPSLAINFSLFIICAVIGVQELINPKLAASLTYSNSNFELTVYGLFNIALIIFYLVTMSYALIWIAAKRSQIKLNQFISRNLPTLQLLPFLGNLAIKFFIICLLASFQKLEYLPLLLMLFLTEYTFESRVIYLSFALRLITCLLLITTCYLVLFGALDSISTTTLSFTCVFGLSTLQIWQQRKRLDPEEV